MLSDKEMDEFVRKHANTSFLWGKESVDPNNLASLLRLLGILPCKDCTSSSATATPLTERMRRKLNKIG